ncbi:TolC family protein [Peribacillus loiseleuriae]|uniref:Transporter n=1 Tax=Peribacillus loiseleuriae TaxID=1679170 RepID=A0A0K9H073_9BACI|nr:TolC family protein [Peribacillus loiseleuriae]KMY51912.1 hypothetical protein AC625_22260 [Peribacillus loiseleuriae]
MKKVIPFLCAATIVGAPFSAYAQEVTELKQSAEVNETVTDSDQTDGELIEEETPEIEQVKELTLGVVIQRGIENSRNLTVLQFNLEAMKSQILDTKSSQGDVSSNIRNLEKKMEALKEERDRLSDTSEIIMNELEQRRVNDALGALTNQINSLETAVKQLETGEVQLQLQGEEAKEGVRLMLTSSYTNLLTLQQQIAFAKKSIQSASQEVNKAQRLLEYGVGTKEEIRQAQLIQTNLEKQLEELEKNYNHTVATLCFDIGVSYNPDIVIQPIKYEVANNQKPENYSSLIDNTYKVKRAQNSLKSAITAYDDSYGNYELAQRDYEVKAAKETVALTKETIETAVEQMYHNEELTYFAYEEALRKLDNVKKDLKVLETKFKVGVVTKYDYEKALTQFDQAELNVYSASIQNYLIQQSIQAFEKGYVQ